VLRAAATALAVAVLAGACGSGTNGRMIVHVRGASSTAPTTGRCFLEIRQHAVGGGTTNYCLQRFTGRPGPNATLRDSGVMTFRLPAETLRARVRIVARFGADGAHATQRLEGTIAGGGSVTGGGPYVERPPGHVASSNFRYVISR
jgi:hypothetical protein